MTTMITRRGLLASSAAASVFALTPKGRAAIAASTTLTVERRSLEVNGRSATVFGISQDNGTSGLSLEPGQRFAVTLRNRIGEPTLVHWHGQTPPPQQDGEPLTRIEQTIADGGRHQYDFAPRAGTHWMHSHVGLQEQMLLAAPLIVRTAEDSHADLQEVTVMLHDFTFRDPREILAGLTGAGKTRTTGSAAHAMSGMTMPMNGSMGGAQKPDLNDVDFDAYLANDRTLDDPQVVRIERNGRIRLRIINGAASTAFWIDLGTLTGMVVAVDGDLVQPLAVRRFPMAEAQRVDVMLRLPAGRGSFPIVAQREGDRQRTGIILATADAVVARQGRMADAAVGPADLSLESRLAGLAPLAARRADRVHRVHLTGDMATYAWGIDGRRWPDHQPLIVSRGERVALDLVNETMMAHPMHLHGHHFQVLALNGRPVSGAMRDTVLVPARGSVRVAFNADNPGRWLFHCHNLYHMASGMITEVAYSGFTPGF